MEGGYAPLSSAKTETRTATRRLDGDDRGGTNRSRRFRGKEDDTEKTGEGGWGGGGISIISGKVRRRAVS